MGTPDPFHMAEAAIAVATTCQNPSELYPSCFSSFESWGLDAQILEYPQFFHKLDELQLDDQIKARHVQMVLAVVVSMSRDVECGEAELVAVALVLHMDDQFHQSRLATQLQP